MASLTHIHGTQYVFLWREVPQAGVPLSPLATTPLALMLDGPDGRRLILRYLNGSSGVAPDGVLDGDGVSIRFTISPDWSRLNLAAGTWNVRAALGSFATQVPVGKSYAVLTVETPLNGPWPGGL